MTQATSTPVAPLQALQVKLLDPRFGDSWPLPAYATEASAGMDLRAALETALTLQPGDMIATGTPKGLADVRPGDEVVVEVEGVGRLVNRIVSEEAK